MKSNKIKIPYVRVGKQAEEEYGELEPIIKQLMFEGNYIGGKYVEKLEKELAEYIGVSEVVTLNSGTDALIFSLALAGIRPGDEVITAPNSFIASASSIAHVGAKPVFVDVLPDQNIDPAKIREKINSRTKAILPVHLTGRPCLMNEILTIAKENNLTVIEDAAQAIGTEINNYKTGAIGDFGCFSAHPLKNLNALGDGGYVATNNIEAASELRILRNHGLEGRGNSSRWGFASRMDALQAAVLSFRLKRLEGVIDRRIEHAQLYKSLLNTDYVFMPEEIPNTRSTFHTFVIQCDDRDNLRAHLLEKGIKTSVHYPVPIHLQPAASKLGYVEGDFPAAEAQAKRILTLPVNQYLSQKEIETISNEVNHFFESKQDYNS
jgi:dTDP-4-amino-4,6-dideoxygalactose transaminase